MDNPEIHLDEELQNQFRALVNQRGGLYFKDHNLKDLNKVIGLRMAGLKISSPKKYYDYLTFSDKREDELRELFNMLTINHTYFFRNKPHFEVLRSHIFPKLLEKKKNLSDFSNTKPQLRIWSAGCSTGEEPYSIVILLRELIDDFDDWDIEIYATDASTDALKKAKEGSYREAALRFTDPIQISNNFEKSSKDEKKYSLRHSIKENVRFEYFNLMDQSYPTEFDIIFCRNVLIYFSADTIKKVIEKFYKSLTPDGYLFIGYSETLQYISDKFEMRQVEDAIFYKPKTRAELDKKTTLSPTKTKPVEKKIFKRPVLPSAASRSVPVQSREELVREVMECLNTKEYDRALSLIRRILSKGEGTLDIQYLSAQILVNQGKYSLAKKTIDEILQKEPMCAQAFYLLASISMDEGQLEDAKKNFKKSLYIDNDFLLAHFMLAMLFKQIGMNEQAIKEYRNTLRTLNDYEGESILPYSDGLTASAVQSVCVDNLERLKSI